MRINWNPYQSRNCRPLIADSRNAMQHIPIILALTVGLLAASAHAQSSSLLMRAYEAPETAPADATVAAATSLFHVPPPEPRRFAVHDLVQIIVHETSRAKSTHELETEKEFNVNGRIDAFPDLNLEDLLSLRLFAGRTTALPELDATFGKEFTGDGEYERRDDLTGRISAEVIEVLPNGNLVLEARTVIRTDDELQEMKLTGVCRPDDVSLLNTVLSNQVHDLRIQKDHEGELREANRKGIIAQVFDLFFAW